MKTLFFKSIRWQVQLWHGLLLILITAVLLVGFYRFEWKVRLQNLNSELMLPMVSLLPLYINPPGEDPVHPSLRDPRHATDLESRGYYIAAWNGEDQPLHRSPDSPLSIPLPDKTKGPVFFNRWNGNNYELCHISPFRDVIILGLSAEKIQREQRQFAFRLILIGVGTVTFGLIGGWWLAGRALRPIANIAATAEDISSGDHRQRIPSQSSTELGTLAVTLNNTFDRLASAYEQQVRFTADASHELRTPTAVILAQTQLTLKHERNSAEYQESLAICQRAAERMKKILGDLLDLSRYDADAPELYLRECDLAEVANESLDFVAPLAEERKVTLTRSVVSIQGRFDPAGLSHALINLLINAIKHNPEGCRVSLVMSREGGRTKILISDTGHGIEAEALPHIFERFYRTDKARSRATGGSGLGLAISKSIVEAHGGTLEVTSETGRGTTLTISIPA